MYLVIIDCGIDLNKILIELHVNCCELLFSSSQLNICTFIYKTGKGTMRMNELRRCRDQMKGQTIKL